MTPYIRSDHFFSTDEVVAQMKFTVMLAADGTQRMTGGLLPNCTELTHPCEDEELNSIYAAAVEKDAKKKAKKAKK